MSIFDEGKERPGNNKVQKSQTGQSKIESNLKEKGNKRLDCIDATNNEGTAAWANEEHRCDVCNVSIPSEDDVERAKNWVDNGSKL